MYSLFQNFDNSIINWLNHLTPRPNLFSSIMVLIWDNDLVKGAVLVMLMWYLWFSNKHKQPHTQERILLSIIACFVAIVVGRALTYILPYRARPVINADVHIATHVQMGISNWSSFPSDHAVMFFSLATGLYLISKKIGLFSYIYVSIFIFLPRIYLGLHYPTDIMAGAIIGILITWLISLQNLTQAIIKRSMDFASRYPGIFYALFFVLTFQIATLFDESRMLGGYFIRVFMKFIQLVM